MTDSRPFKMTISLDVLHHLGIGLYSNIPAVLSELVANAWDADATEVEITLDHDTPAIEIRDNGHGMNQRDINEKFLKVGYRRRADHATTPSGRKAMGRKGIGKLAAFSIADTVDVHTADGTVASAFRMDTDDIKAAAAAERDYFPDPLPPSVEASRTGTLIALTRMRKALAWTAPHLRRRLARRFSVIGPYHDFQVAVDGTAIAIADRDYFKDMEFIWHFGEQSPDWDFSKAPAGENAGIVPAEVTLDPPSGGAPVQHKVRGFIGTVEKPAHLDDVNNAIVLSARGRLIHEDMLPEYRQSRVYTEYVVGEVLADFLDDDEDEDIVTSGRQRVQQEDHRYTAVKGVVDSALHRIRDDWDRKRKAKARERALDYPSVKKWYTRMGPDKKRTARRLFGKIEALRIDDAEAKYQLYRASMLAFEKLALRDMLSALDAWETHRDFELLARLMTGVDEIEATRYREIVDGRLQVIEKLKGMLPDALERILQQHLFDHLWLLHPSWERAAAPRMEESVRAEFSKIDAGLTDDEKRGRVDLRFQTVPGRHVIVELKRYNRRVTANELVAQLRKYRDALQKCLKERYPSEPEAIECVAVLGSAPTPVDDPETNRKLLDAIGARYVTYDELVTQAEASYRDYLSAKAQASDLDELLQQLAADFGLPEATAGVGRDTSPATAFQPQTRNPGIE